MIAAAAQLPEISCYHEQIAMNLWWTTLNSFWAARIEQFYDEAEMFTARVTLRRISIFASVVLGTTFQVVIEEREDSGWDRNAEGRCYLYKDDTSMWPWIVGTALYGLSLLLNIFPLGRPLLEGYARGFDRGQKILNSWCLSTFGGVGSRHSKLSKRSTRARSLLKSQWLQRLLSTVAVILFFLVRQFLALWSYGDGFYHLQTVAYIGFTAWNTFDNVSLKTLNKPLVVGGENKWGFGQVFPVVMIVAIGFVAFDAVLGKILHLSV